MEVKDFMDLTILLGSLMIGGFLAFEILRPKPNAVILEKIGDNYYLTKGFHNGHYLQHRGLTFRIPSTYEYWVRLGRGFIRFKPKWMRFFYIQNTQLAEIKEDKSGEEEEAKSKITIDQKLFSDFMKSETLTQILRSFTIPKTTILMYLIIGVAMGLMLGVILAGWVHG